ncbi:plasminogen activator inhibitor 1 RNA-binding protein-like isoform X2 [Coccinella septempunctata]|uniref:plasminogen activator inhibitor 1 RNA-binding protein-like isoform X2 n=1 Tax=Coccinella septempunctata TaxID=41139 RepID=UPI001D0787AF|nr:plasminogen activator inhibitor 1 RNA-binding protein-like isoform X2 [Coccinella septempunctata]
MENVYGIGVANRYALFLDDESDPLEALKQKEEEREAKKKVKVAEKENTKTKQEIQPKSKTGPVAKKTKEIIGKSVEKRDDLKSNIQKGSNDGKNERSFEKKNNENREAVNNRRNREDNRSFRGNERGEFRKDREDRIRNNNTGDFENRPRPERGDRNNRERNFNKPGENRGPRKPFNERRGKREFDRQSGSDKTGVKHVDKRDGSGPHNWGSNKDVIEEADPNKTTESNDKWAENEANVSNESKGEDTSEPEAPQPEEPKELTLDEWKAQRAGRAKPTYNIRKAGEGEDPSQWKKMYELKKKEDEEETEEEEYEMNEYPQRVGRQKHILDIDIQFNDSRRPGQGRGKGPRSGPRGPGNKPNPRGERPERRFRDDQGEEKQDVRRAPKVDDERDFPSLG